jgi:hypothetical protein
MASIFQSEAIADIVIAVMAIEALVLIALRSRFRNLQIADAIAFLAAGFFLALALRAAMTGAAWPWLAACLAAAFLAHVADMWRRLSRQP